MSLVADKENMEAANDFYGPWLGLMLWIGLPLLLVATPFMFFFERGSVARWLVGRLALFGWASVLLSVALRLIFRVLQDAFASFLAL